MFLVMLMYASVAAAIVYLVRWLDERYRRSPVPDLASKRVLVTGTDTGLGRQVALDLCRQGITVYAGCYTEDAVRQLQSEPGVRDKMKAFLLDVTSDESVNNAKKFIMDDLPKGQGLWALVNNAAIVGGVAADWTTVNQFHEVMNVNFYGQVRMSIAFLPLLKLARGRLVNVASIMGRFALSASPYVVSKFAVQAYTSGMRRHVAVQGVKTSIIESGTFKSNLSSSTTVMNELSRQWKSLPEERKEELGGEAHREKVEEVIFSFFDNYPLSSRNRVEEVTDAVRHSIVSQRPKARYVCGLDGRFLYRPASFMPDWLADRLFNYIFS